MRTGKHFLLKLATSPRLLFPYVSSLLIHALLILGFMYMSPRPTPKKLRLFQETLVSLPTPKSVATLSPPPASAPKPAPKPQSSSTPQPRTAPQKPATPPKPTATPKAKTPPPSKTIKKQRVQALLQLAEQLEHHAQEQDSQLHQAQHQAHTTPQPSYSSEQQNLELQQLVYQYVILPSHRDIRVRISRNPEGVECVILSDIEEIYKQQLLTQLQAIPFQQFFNKYKTSKNIVFHITLRTSES